MATGWAREGAVQEQIDSTVADGVQAARAALRGEGRSRPDCAECGEPIPQARRDAVPGVQFCVACQSEADRHARHRDGINRRGSKDSQLR